MGKNTRQKRLDRAMIESAQHASKMGAPMLAPMVGPYAEIDLEKRQPQAPTPAIEAMGRAYGACPQPSLLTAYGRVKAVADFAPDSLNQTRNVNRKDLATLLENYDRLLAHYRHTLDCPEHGRSCQDAHCPTRERASREVSYDPFVK